MFANSSSGFDKIILQLGPRSKDGLTKLNYEAFEFSSQGLVVTPTGTIIIYQKKHETTITQL